MSYRLDYESAVDSVAKGLALAGYDVQHAIGAGSGCQVYKALQRSTGQLVAIKVMASDDLDGPIRQRRVERFRREIAFCSSLYHPDIVRLLDSGELGDGSRFAVFEFIPGRTLAELLRDEGTLKVQRARNLLAQLLPPLAYAHAKGIAHRDLKPGNIMVTNVGGRDRLKLLDFGISIYASPRDAAELARLTQSHEWVGTPLYAAPEQLRGEPTGPKSDLYAWALTFVECLTGSPLVSGKSLLEIVAQQSRPDQHVLPAPLSQHRLGALLLRVLEKDPARRLGDAHLVQSLLERISLEGLEDTHGYLRETSPVSSQQRIHRPSAETVTDGEPTPQTEQRHVTVLCCKVSLVGTGQLSSIEQMDALLDDSHNLVSEVLRQFGAISAQSLGGYSLWYFGLSQTRDAEARLAMRAALEVVHRMETLPRWFAEAGISLSAQIGIHAGPVTLQISEAGRKPVDGVTARIAMELASQEDATARAKPEHRVLVSEDFRDMAARDAELEELGAGELRLSYTDRPAKAYRLKGESRATAFRAERAPFVGRAEELSRLTEAWQRTGAGEGSAVLLEGEPGVGKSRLAAELMLRLHHDGCRGIEARCLPEWQNASLRPLQLLVLDLLGWSDSEAKATDRLERQLVELALDPATAVPLFCAWLGVSLPSGHTPLAHSPQKQRQLLHACISDFLIAIMKRGAALLVEDLHWADPSTLECLDILLSKARTHAVLAIMTTRPDRAFTWTAPPTLVTLSGLTSTSAAELAASLVPHGALSSSDLDRMVARADGIPLYLEELAIAFGVHGQQKAESVPPGLRNLLTSRLEVLGKGLETAQFAAALGREFSIGFLAALQTKDELSLIGDLEELVSAQILVKRLRVEGPMFGFRHALIRDAAYESMSIDARQRCHELIADGLEQKYAELADTQPDVLAHHFERAGAHEKAMRFWHAAAQRASVASAHVEALSHIERALAARLELPDDPRLGVEHAAILLTRGAILVATRGYPAGAPDFERIIGLVPAEGPTLHLAFAARWGFWNFNNARCSLDVSTGLASELKQLAETSGDTTLSLAAWAAVCLSKFCTGRLEEAVEASRCCAEEYDIDQHRDLTLRYGDDPRVSSGSFEALAEMIRGRHDLATQRVDEVLQLIDELGFLAQKAGMHGQSAWVYLIWGGSGAEQSSYALALEHAERALQLAREHGFPFWELYGNLMKAAIRSACGEPGAAAELKTYSDIWCSFGAKLGRCWHLTFAGQGLHRSGSFAEALQAFDEALDFCESHGSRFFEAEVRRQRALLLADPKNPNRDLPRALEECWKGADQSASIGAHWWQLACLVTGIRLAEERNTNAYESLRELLGTRFPASSTEPPLVREARALVA